MGIAKKLLWVGLLLGAAAASAQDKQMRIQFAEPVKLKAAAGHTEFDAYGRRFSADLQQNVRLLQALPAGTRSRLAKAKLLRGKLAGQKGSWVRLTQVGSGLEGAIWDGHDLYVVTTLARIQKNLTTPIDASPGQTVVYRLSDTLDSLPEAFCGLDEKTDAASSRGVSGLKQYRNLVTQIATAAATAPAEQLNLSLIADAAFQLDYANQAADEMLARLNIVDGIFTDQIGILLQPTELRMVPLNDDPFTTTNPNQLLDQLSDYRTNTPEVRTAGLAHLFTGKNLDGTTIGIAYRDSLCDPSFGVSLSESQFGSLTSALVMAHELGHNFGAQHDGVAGGACATTGSSFLMAPELNGSALFSDCSRNSIAQSVERARGICIVPAQYADLAASAPADVDATANSVFKFPVTVSSVGNVTAIDATLKLSLPASISFQGAALPEGACTTAGSEVTCQLGDIAAGTERVIEVNLMSSQFTSTQFVTNVSAANDYRTSNGSTRTYIRFTSGIDLKVEMSASPTSLYANDPLDLTLDVTSMGSLTASGGVLNVWLSGLVFDSATAGAHTCAAESEYQVRCNLADVLVGSPTRIVLHVHGVGRGNLRPTASVQVANDANYRNNDAGIPIQTISENDFNISASADSLLFETGSIQEVVYTLSAIGRIPSPNAQLRVSAPWNGVLESIATDLGICSLQFSNLTGACDFGDLAPGQVRTVTVRFRTTSHGGSVLGAQTNYNTDAHTVWINSSVTHLYSNLPVDAIANTQGSWSLEGETTTTYAGIQSVGLQPAQNVVATLEVPEQVRLTTFGITNSNDWTCTLQTPQRGRCTGAFTATGVASIQYAFISDVPGSYTTKLSITADDDADAANNVSESTLTIAPFLDVAISATETQMQLVGGQDRAVQVTVTTGVHPVPRVTLSAGGGSGFEIASISVDGVICTVDANYGYGRCELGDLPANANVPGTLIYRTNVDGASGVASVSVTSSMDHNTANNSIGIGYTTTALTDISLQVAQPSASAVAGTWLAFPRITVSNVGAASGRLIVVTIPLPAFGTARTVSGSGVYCTGTSTLTCDVAALAPGASTSIDLSLHANVAGEFSSNVTVQSANDSVASNNSARVQLNATPITSGGGGSSSSSSGGASSGKSGGGGRFEWLALLILGLCVADRTRRAAPGCRPA